MGRKHVKCVLEYHKEKYGTHIEIRDKTQNVRSDLKGKSDWDWVCYDAKTGNEVAVEVKKITREDLEAKSGAIYNVLHEIRVDLLGKLPGSFSLSASINDDYDFPFKKRPKNKQLFKKALSKAIMATASGLDVGETKDITSQVSKEIPFDIPLTVFFDLYRGVSKNSMLAVESPMVGGSPVPLEKFEQLISHANEQLRVAKNLGKTEKTFLVLIEERLNPTDPSEVAEAFKNIDSASYSAISHVYFIRGEEIAEIPLPTP